MKPTDSNFAEHSAASILRGKKPKFAVVHWGPRLHYAAPAALARMGMLQAMYADAHSKSLPDIVKRLLNAHGWMPTALRRMYARVLPEDISLKLVKSFPYFNVQQSLLSRILPSGARTAARYKVGSQGIAMKLTQNKFEGANAVYAHACASTYAVKHARDAGLYVVIESISMPTHKIIELEEYQKFSMEMPRSRDELLDDIDFFKEETGFAHLILAASQHVKKGLIEIGVPENKIAVVPYGLDTQNYARESNPIPGRILYVGKIGYLKGVQYYAEACRILKKQDINCEIRAAGPSPESLHMRPEFQGPEYIGALPRNKIIEEYRSADVFVFPTLSDGFGLVLLEAMAHGIPVITTGNCADVVEDGVSGFIVPPRDSAAIADKISALVSDRELRERVSCAAKETVEKYSLDAYSRRLGEVITNRYRDFQFDIELNSQK